MDITSVLKTIAPWIGTALGGPLGGLAVDAATSALGCSEKTTEGLKNALAGVTQEDLLKLKEADQNFQVTMQSLGFKQVTDLETIAANDRKDARAMEVATKSSVPRNLTYFLTAGMTGLIVALIFKGIPDSPVVQLLLGTYTTAWIGATTYWFGTTAHSEDKTALIAKAEPIKA